MAGCDVLGYYGQAASGPLSIIRSRHSIEQLLQDPDTDVNLKTQLQLVMELRAIAGSELQLPVEEQFTHYVDLKRNSVVWNVFAAPELSLEPKTWCYPIAGCSAYRGYFNEQHALDYAALLAGEGFDSYVGGVAAYSTLGWLNDPILNTFVYREESQLADLIFHELAHQLLYIPGDTGFNESFATAVAAEGVRRWLEKRDNVAQYADYKRGKRRQNDFVELIGRYRVELAAVYDAALQDAEKRNRKSEKITRLRQDFKVLQQQWGDSQAYHHWVVAPINNGKLNSVALYHDLVPVLEKWLAEENHQLSSFYSRCRALKTLNPEQRRGKLTPPSG